MIRVRNVCTLTGDLLPGLVGRVIGVRGRSVYSDRRPAFGSCRQSDWSEREECVL